MRSIGKIAKPTRTLVEEFQALGYRADDVQAMAEMTGEQGLIGVGGQGVQPTSGEVVKNGGGVPSAAAPDDSEGAEVEVKKESRLKKKAKKENAPPGGPAAPKAPGAPPMGAGGQPAMSPEQPMMAGKRAAGESSGKSSAPDRLEVILSDLQGLVHESKNFDATKNALIRSFANVSKIAQAVSEKLDENISGNREFFWSLDELAEEALTVAEGLIEGTVSVKSAHEGINGYVKDLIEHLGPIADELDSNIAAALRGLSVREGKSEDEGAEEKPAKTEKFKKDTGSKMDPEKAKAEYMALKAKSKSHDLSPEEEKKFHKLGSYVHDLAGKK